MTFTTNVGVLENGTSPKSCDVADTSNGVSIADTFATQEPRPHITRPDDVASAMPFTIRFILIRPSEGDLDVGQ